MGKQPKNKQTTQTHKHANGRNINANHNIDNYRDDGDDGDNGDDDDTRHDDGDGAYDEDGGGYGEGDYI